MSLASIALLSGADYYVAPPAFGGADTNSGTLGSPFATIQHAANTAVAGDTVYIRGGIYRESVTPSNSGTAGARITYKNYPGETPVISGTEIISPASWSLDSGNIYKAALPGSFFSSAINQTLQVFVDGEMVTLAKWPDVTTNTAAYPSGTTPPPTISTPAKAVISSFGSKTRNSSTNWTTSEVTDSSLPPKPAGFYEGAQIFFQPNNEAWSWAFTGTVTSVPANGTRITFISRSNAGKDLSPEVYDSRSRYYLFNKKEFLDTPGEWWHDTANGQIYLWAPGSGDPSTKVVEVKKRDFAFNLSNRNYITVQGIVIFACSITTDSASGGDAIGYDSSGNELYPWRGAWSIASSTGIVLDGIKASYLNHFTDISGHFILQWGTSSGIVLGGTGHTMTNCVIEKGAGNGVLLQGIGHSVSNNLFEDLAYCGTDCAAITTTSPGDSWDHVISYNTIRRTGRAGITPRGLRNTNAEGGEFKARIHHNDIAHFGLQDWDVGGIYTYGGDAKFARIDHNLVSEGIGYTAAGIYFDYAKNWVVNNNVIWNVEWAIKFQADNAGVSNMLAYNNTCSVRNTSGHSFGPFGFGNSNGSNVGTVVQNNIVLCHTPPAAPGYEPIGSTPLSAFSSSLKTNNLFWDGISGSVTDPKFENPATTLNADPVSFMILASSAAIDSGSAVPSYTRDGIAVPAFSDPMVGIQPDAGAYEFGNTPWTAGASLNRCSAPEFAPPPGSYTAPVTVSLTSGTAGSTIRYTTDGTAPTASTGSIYSTPFEVTSSTTVKAFAVKSGLDDSSVVTAQYTLAAPVITSGQAPTLTMGSYQSFSVLASGSPTSWSIVSGTLPAGLNFNTSTGEISGTPGLSGVFPLNFTATNPIGTSASATVILTISSVPVQNAHEHFGQSAGTALNSVPSSGSGWSTNWSTGYGSNGLISPESLSYSAGGKTLLSSGGALLRNSWGQTKISLDTTAFPGLVTSDGIGGSNASGKSLFVSFLIKGANSGVDTVLQLSNGSNFPVIGVRSQNAATWSIQYGGGYQQNTGVNVDESTTYFVVIRLDFVAGGSNDQLRAYINPGSLDAEPASANAEKYDLDFSDIRNLEFYTNGNGNRTIDEIRVGTTYASVTPKASPLSSFRSVNMLAANGSEDLDTPAGDGVPNILKYAFNMIGSGLGQTPSVSAPNRTILSPTGQAGLPLIEVTANTGGLQIVYIRRKASSNPEITYFVEFSNSLAPESWSQNTSAVENVTALDSVFERVTVTDSTASPIKRFARLKITVQH